jgi:hypothetical protein
MAPAASCEGPRYSRSSRPPGIARGEKLDHRFSPVTVCCMNKRLLPRLRRRLQVWLGDRPAFTSDVSTGGFALELMATLLPGTMVHGQLRLGEREVPFTGTVTWSKKAEPRLQVRGRAGVRFTGVDPSFFELFQR